MVVAAPEIADFAGGTITKVIGRGSDYKIDLDT
jgi:hypothetical protein